MIKNYLKIAFRNLWRHKAFSFINIVGLAVGMAACFLICLYVNFELSYDSFHSKKNDIYRLVTDIKTPSETINIDITAWPFAPNIKNDFPEVDAFVRTSRSSVLIRRDDKKFQEDQTLLVDSSIFRIFDFPLLKGNPSTCLKEPFSIVLTETAAKKYFGSEDPMGKTLLVTGDGVNATVTGVMRDLPENSQIKADLFLSMTTQTLKFNPDQDQQWSNFDAKTYLLLKPGTNALALQKKLPAFLEKRTGKEMAQNQMYFTLFLEPIADVYLKSSRNGEVKGNMNNVYTFTIVALFILLIACINFINLTTARSAERAKEVGIKKVVGAEKGQLTRQFMGESLLLSMLAFVLAVTLAGLFLPLFNQLAGKTISHSIFSPPTNILWLWLAAVAVGLLAGIYPALILSSFKPILVLKGRFATGRKGIALRKGLVIAQFAISIALIIGTLVVFNQMNFMRSRDLGFSKDQTIVIDTYGDASKLALKEEIGSIPGVSGVSLSSSVPGAPNSGAYSMVENNKGDMQIANLDLYFVDFDFIPQYKIKLVAGRPFSKEFMTDTTQAMVINEETVKLLGYPNPQAAIGKKFNQWGREGQIIGVVKNFHFRSLQEPIKPLSMRIEPERNNLLSVHVNAGKIPQTLTAIENKWKGIITKRPFSYYFLDEFFDRQYRAEIRFGSLFLDFAILAIFISCLGLLGLASYSTLQRTKEIGIRKVLGASTPNIVLLLSSNFLQLVAISFLIAAPAAWYFMREWLQDFAYRTDISWWVFLLAGIIAILFALVTVSFQAVRAAIANPVKSIQTE